MAFLPKHPVSLSRAGKERGISDYFLFAVQRINTE